MVRRLKERATRHFDGLYFLFRRGKSALMARWRPQRDTHSIIVQSHDCYEQIHRIYSPGIGCSASEVR